MKAGDIRWAPLWDANIERLVYTKVMLTETRPMGRWLARTQEGLIFWWSESDLLTKKEAIAATLKEG